PRNQCRAPRRPRSSVARHNPCGRSGSGHLAIVSRLLAHLGEGGLVERFHARPGLIRGIELVSDPLLDFRPGVVALVNIDTQDRKSIGLVPLEGPERLHALGPLLASKRPAEAFAACRLESFDGAGQAAADRGVLPRQASQILDAPRFARCRHPVAARNDFVRRGPQRTGQVGLGGGPRLLRGSGRAAKTGYGRTAGENRTPQSLFEKSAASQPPFHRPSGENRTRYYIGQAIRQKHSVRVKLETPKALSPIEAERSSPALQAKLKP